MNWKAIIQTEKNKPYFKEIENYLQNTNAVVYPPEKDRYTAFELCSFENTKVVLIGQDPYINEYQAHGLAFSVLEGKIPPSLLNIKKELFNEFGYEVNDKTNLTCWAEQGVLLLNRVLSVEAKKANSHKGIGWEKFSENIIRILSEKKNNLVFILLGSPAQQCEKFIDVSKHLIIKEVHPSPLSAYRGFFNSNIFIKTNEYLKKYHHCEINWEII